MIRKKACLPKRNRKFVVTVLAAAFAILAMLTHDLEGQIVIDSDPALQAIEMIEHLGDTIPVDVLLTNDAGNVVALGDYFSDDRPVILIMAYYTCPMLCNLIMNGVVEGAKGLDWLPGDEYHLLTVSIDPTETVELAAAKKENYVESFGRPGVEKGWTFFVATGGESRRLADAIGFQYFYDEALEQYAHPAVITVVTGDGVISRYLYGIEFKERDLRLALVEASEGKIGSTMDRILLYCYHYDPDAGGYVVLAARVMTLGGVATVVILALFLGGFWLRELRRKGDPKAHRAE